MLLVGQYETNQIKMFTLLHTKTLLLVGHYHINQAGIFTSALH